MQFVKIIISCFNATQYIKNLCVKNIFQDIEILRKPNWFDVPDIGIICFLHLLEPFR